MTPAQQDDGDGPLGRWRARRRARRDRRDTAHRLYAAVVARARQPVFYAHLGVPDTNDGRLELIGLHAALVMRRLTREGDAGQALAQDLFDLMFADIDRTLRELGVGDLSVGKKVKSIASSFMGRAAALEAALAASDRAAVAVVLERNLYVTGELPPQGRIEALADYLIALDAELLASPGASLLAGCLPPRREIS
jgi:cytochrome b pre-mRNA-processing protein 3